MENVVPDSPNTLVEHVQAYWLIVIFIVAFALSTLRSVRRTLQELHRRAEAELREREVQERAQAQLKPARHR